MRNSGFKILISAVFYCLIFLVGISGLCAQNTDEYNTLNSDRTSRQLRSVPAKEIGAYKKDKKFEYANDPEYWTKQEPEPETVNNKNVDISGGLVFFKRILFLIFSIGLGIFLLWIIFRRSLKIFSGAKKTENINLSQETIDADFEALDHKIQNAINTADYRLAVRYLYLKTIKELNDKQIISFSGSFTDSDFEHSLSKTSYASGFRYLRNVYEYVWYGEFSINADQFESVNHRFKNFISAI